MAEEQLQNLTNELQQRCRPHNRQAKSRAGCLSRTGAYLGQGRVPNRGGGGYLSRTSRTSRTGQTSRTTPASENPASAASDSSDSSDLSDLSDKGTPAKALPRKAPPQRHPRKGTPAPPSWLPHIVDNELLL